MSEFPGFWRFAWLFFMQPVTLHRRLKARAIERPGESGYRLWKRRREWTPYERWWAGSLARLLLVGAPVGALISGAATLAFGHQVDFWGLVVVGASSVALGVAMGAALDLTWGTAWGVATGVAAGAAVDLIWGAAWGVAMGAAVGVESGVAFGSVAGVVISAATGLALSAVRGVAVGVAFCLSFLRIPVYLIELVLSSAAAFAGRLDWCPVRFHDLSYLPHPFLRRTIVDNAAKDPALAREVLDACAIAPGQRRTGRLAEAELQAGAITGLIRLGRFADLAELNAPWLPGRLGADPLLLAIAEAGQYMAAARAARNPHHRVAHLQRLGERLQAIQTQLRQDNTAFTRPFAAPVAELTALAREDLKHARSEAARVLLNPFRAGDPLTPEEGAELFVGREPAISQIEDLLADSARSASLVLLAPRRCGKTSLLKMLPAKLPDTVCVFFDLQANPVSSPGAFFERLAEHTILAARRDRRFEAPPLPSGPPIEAAARWLDKLEEAAGSRRILISIDEFERLEDLYTGSRQEMLQMLGLIRAGIQHKRHVRFLVSGASPFDELSSVWDDHFINTQQVRLGFLDAASAERLLCRPAPGFPENLIPREVAEEIFARTGGQPFLVQMYGSKLVARLAAEPGRRNAVREDVAAIEPRVFEAADSFFRHSFTSAPDVVRPFLSVLARGEPLNGDSPPGIRRWLDRRNLLDADGRLTIPAFGTWIEIHTEHTVAQ